MSDINSGLPIRTQLPSQANYDDVVFKLGDGTTSTQLASVDTHGSVQSRLADATGAVITSQTNGSQRALDVGINVAGVQIDPRQIRALIATDVVTSNQGSAAATHAGYWWTRLTDGTNDSAILATGELKVSVTQLLTEDHNYGAVGTSTLRTASQIGNSTGGADFGNGATGTQTLRVAANLAVAGVNVSSTNPVPVSLSSAPLGTPVNNYNTVSAVAANATSNHDYTITTGKTFQGKKIWASASGLMKIEVQISPDGVTFPTLWVGWNSTANPNITIDMDQMVFLESGTGSKVRIIRTNQDGKPQNLYSTISGTEV